MENAFEYWHNLILYLLENSIFNTYITAINSDGRMDFIIKSKNQKLNDLLSHLKPYQKIKKDDPIINETCSICFDEFKENEFKRSLDECNHTFHKKCIDKWFRKNSSSMNCPLCRKNYNSHIIIDENNQICKVCNSYDENAIPHEI